MTAAYEEGKNRKALLWTGIVLGVLFLLIFLIKWQVTTAAPPPVADLIEINLGNEAEGFGEEQPLVKGEKGPAATELSAAAQATAASEKNAEKAPAADDNNDDEPALPAKKIESPKAAVTPKPVTPAVKPGNTAAASTTPKSQNTVQAPAAPKPQKARLTYNGPGSGTGNNPSEDNGYTGQGRNPNERGDAGNPNGNPDSYGNSPGGRVGGPKVISGNRKVVRFYSFTGDLPKATIYAQVNVSPEGSGSLLKLVKPSTSMSTAYADAIRNYLKKMSFDKSDQSSTVTVQFNFTVE